MSDFSWIASKFEGNIISELIYIRDQKGGIPLHCAAGIGHLGAVRKILLEDNLGALERNTKGYLPIHVACKKGRVHVVKQLLEEQEWLDPMELLNRRGQNILHVAAKNGKHEVVKYILREKMLLLNEKDKNGNTSLHLAAKNLYANVLLLLTQAKTIDLNLVNNQGLTAIDYACHRIERALTTPEFLSFAVLHSAGCRLSKMGKLFIRTKSARIEMKEHIQILMVVLILVATVTFAAGLTMPGGFNSSEDIKKRGMATLVNRGMFQVFTICDVVAMYSSTIGSSILFWGLLVDTDIAMWAACFAFHLVGIALVTMSIAFMAGVHLVVSDLHWLADVVIVIGIFFLFMLWVAYVMLIFPIGVRAPFFRHISNLIIRILIPFSGRYGKFADKKKKKTASEQQQKRDETKDELGQVRIHVPEESQVTS